MKKSDQHFWPYKPKISILSAIILLIVLLLITGILRSTIGWPSDGSTNTVLIGILLISLLPVLLAILDVIIDRGGKIGYGDFKIDFSKVQNSSIASITVPANIGVPGQAVSDSGTMDILKALRESTANSVVIIDLEEGQAWWETRLLVLLSGAVRLGCPDKIVFVATKSGRQQSFIGWASASKLLNCLLKPNTKYQRPFHIAKSIAAQWRLVSPLYPIPPQNVQLPQALIWIQGEAKNRQWMAFDNNTGLPNEFFEEQVLQNELGREIERVEGGNSITISGLGNLFESVLNRNSIEKNLSTEEQMKGYFKDDESFIAITENGKYTSLVSRLAVFNELLKNLVSDTIEK